MKKKENKVASSAPPPRNHRRIKDLGEAFCAERIGNVSALAFLFDILW